MPTIGSETYSSNVPPEVVEKSTAYSESFVPPDAVVGIFTPVITGLNPDTLPVPGPDAWIVVHGEQFTPISVIVWNDQEVETEFVNEGKLRTEIKMTAEGIDPVYVKSGRLKSNVVDFTFTAADGKVSRRK